MVFLFYVMCNLFCQTCRPKIAGSTCRSADHECDLPEYCTGQSEYCPDDVFKMDGESCDRGKVSDEAERKYTDLEGALDSYCFTEPTFEGCREVWKIHWILVGLGGIYKQDFLLC